MASAPTCSPEISLGRYLRFCAVAAVAADLIHAQVRVRPVGQSHGSRGPADLLHRHDVGEIAHAGAAVVFLDRDAEQPELAQLAPQVHGEGVVVVDCAGARGDLDGSEVAHGFAQHVDGFAQPEVEGRDGPNALGVGELHCQKPPQLQPPHYSRWPAFLPRGSGRVEADSLCNFADVMELLRCSSRRNRAPADAQPGSSGMV